MDGNRSETIPPGEWDDNGEAFRKGSELTL